MPNYLQYKKMMAVFDYDDSDIESWITVKGNHIPIRKGQTKEEAVKSFIDRKKDVANKIVDRVHGHAVGGWIGSQKEYKDLFYRNENGKTKSNEEMHKFADRVETEVRMARKTPQFKNSVMSAHSIAMGDLQKEMPASMKKTFTPERHKELMEKKFKDKDEDVIFGNWNYSDQYHNEFFNDEGNWLDDEAEKRYEYMKKVENKFDEIYENKAKEFMTSAANKIVKQEPDLYEHKNPIQNLRNSFGSHYDKLYNDRKLDNESDYLLKEWDKHIKNPEFKKQVQQFVEARGDFISSDREVKAFMLAAKENGLIPQENEAAKGMSKTAEAKKSDSPLVNAVAKALNKSPAEAEKEIEGAAQWVRDMMKANDLRNGDVEETLRGLGVESDYAEELLQWASSPKKKSKAPKVKWVDAKKFNDPRSDPFYALYN